MDYIVLDFEWDGAFYPKIGRFINQILQIGAVKLNENFEVTDTFERTVRSSFSKRVSKRFTELTGITKETMLSGVSLESAFCDYNKWASDDAVTMTWSNSDIYTLIENQDNLLSGVKLKIGKYLDLQRFIQGEMKILGMECNSQISLSNAADVLGIEIDRSNLHNAKADSMVSCQLLKKYYNRERFLPLIADTSDPDYFAKFHFKPYFIKDLNDRGVDKTKLNFSCGYCFSPLKTEKIWRFKNGTFFADMICPVCGKKFSARVRFRKYYDKVKVKRNLVEIKDKEQGENEM